MSEFESIVIGKRAIPSLVITIMLMVAVPVIFFIWWRKEHKVQTRISWFLAGAVGFIVSARVLELGVHLVCIREVWCPSGVLSFGLSSGQLWLSSLL